MIVRYGEKVMCNLTDEEGNEVPVTVVEYVINDLKEDELAFHNPLHRRILSEASEHIHDQEFASERFFVAHPDPQYNPAAEALYKKKTRERMMKTLEATRKKQLGKDFKPNADWWGSETKD